MGGLPPLGYDAVDRKLVINKNEAAVVRAPARQSSTNTKQNCILTGLVFDEKKERLSPSYCRKGGRRYRYYISKRLLHGAGKNDGWRIPAGQLEEVVLKELSRFMVDSARVADVVHGNEDDPIHVQASVRVAAKLAKTIEKGQLAEATGPIRKIIERVVIVPNRLRIEISRAGFSDFVGKANGGEGSPIILETPMSIRRRGSRARSYCLELHRRLLAMKALSV